MIRQPLSAEEIQLLDQLFNLATESRHQLKIVLQAHSHPEAVTNEVEEEMEVAMPSKTISLDYRAMIFASGGAIEEAASFWSLELGLADQLRLATKIARTAWRLGELDTARQWARQGLACLEQATVLPDRLILASEALVLVEVFDALGLTAETQACWVHFNRLRQLNHPSEWDGFRAIEIAVQTGEVEQARRQILGLVPLHFGHSRGHIIVRMLRALLQQGLMMEFWAMMGIPTAQHERDSMFYCAVIAGVLEKQYTVALIVAAKEDYDKGGLLQHLAEELVAQGQLANWKKLWEAIRPEYGGLFSTTSQLDFLTVIAEHCEAEDYPVIRALANMFEGSLPHIRNEELVLAMQLRLQIIFAWMGDADKVADLLGKAPIQKNATTFIRAGVLHDMEFLVDAAILSEVPKSWDLVFLKFYLEIQFALLGKPNRAYEHLERMCKWATDAGDYKALYLHRIGTMIKRDWKNREMLEWFLKDADGNLDGGFPTIEYLIEPAIQAGDFTQVLAWMKIVKDPFGTSELIYPVIERSLMARNGLLGYYRWPES